MRYQLIGHFGRIWYCPAGGMPIHPYYNEQLQMFPDIRKDEETFRSIARRLNFENVVNFSDQQKIAVFREYEKLRAVRLEASHAGYKFNLTIEAPSKDAGRNNGFKVEGFIDHDGKVTVLKKEPVYLACPKCLPGNALVDTPSGMVPVSELKPRMLVWTQDAHGNRIAAPILKTAAVPVTPGQFILHLVLHDGRELRVSPAHPTADGRTLGQLEPKSAIDGSWVERIELESYEGSQTYDLLPAGETGFYWANGILLGSTLR